MIPHALQEAAPGAQFYVGIENGIYEARIVSCYHAAYTFIVTPEHCQLAGKTYDFAFVVVINAATGERAVKI